MLLEQMNTLQAEAALKKDPVVILPVGSIEQHGTHSALGTDYIVPNVLAQRVESMENVVVLPALPYGCCPYHMGFAGSIDIGVDGVHLVVSRIVSSLMKHGAKKFLFLNGHGGNGPALDKAAIEAYQAGATCCCIDWWTLVAELNPDLKGGHADKQETSVMLALSPDYVDFSAVRDCGDQNPTQNLEVSYIQGVKLRGGTVKILRNTEELAPNGWFGPGHPRDATAEYGRECLDTAAAFIADFIREFHTL